MPASDCGNFQIIYRVFAVNKTHLMNFLVWVFPPLYAYNTGTLSVLLNSIDILICRLPTVYTKESCNAADSVVCVNPLVKFWLSKLIYDHEKGWDHPRRGVNLIHVAHRVCHKYGQIGNLLHLWLSYELCVIFSVHDFSVKTPFKEVYVDVRDSLFWADGPVAMSSSVFFPVAVTPNPRQWHPLSI